MQPGPASIRHTTVIDPTDMLKHPTSSRFPTIRPAKGNDIIGDNIGNLLMGLPHVRFAIKRVKDQVLDFGKAAISLVKLSFG